MAQNVWERAACTLSSNQGHLGNYKCALWLFHPNCQKMFDTVVRDALINFSGSEGCVVVKCSCAIMLHTQKMHSKISLACVCKHNVKVQMSMTSMTYKHGPECLGTCSMHIVIKSRTLANVPCGDFTPIATKCLTPLCETLG